MMEKYYCSFHEDYFINSICNHLSFKFIPCDVKINNIKYWLTVFFNTESEKYQIGAVGYGGIFPFPETPDLFFDVIKETSKKLNIIFDKIVLPPYFTYNRFNSVPYCEYNISVTLTSILNMEEYRQNGWNIFKDSVRTDIRYSVNHDVTVNEFDFREDNIEKFYLLYIDTMKRVKSSYYTPLNLIKDLLKEKNKVKLYLAHHNNEIIAGSIFLVSDRNIFYWINANSYSHRHLKPNHFILYNVIEKYKNYDYINFGYSHAASLKNFKASWGCKDEMYYILTYRGER